MTFTPIWLVVTYHVAALIAVAVWAPWWVLLVWLFLCFAVIGCVSDKRSELLLVFIPWDVGIEREDLRRKVEAAHASSFVSLFIPLLRLRRRGLIESWNEFDEPLPPPPHPDGKPRHSAPRDEQTPREWRTYYRRLRWPAR